MSMQKLRGIRNTGAYTAQRGVAEKLLLIEDDLSDNEILRIEVNHYLALGENSTLKEIIKKMILLKFREQKIPLLTHAIFQEYLHTTTGMTAKQEKKSSVQQAIRGVYTSELFNHLTGDQPFEIDLKNQPCDWLFCNLNSERPINIQNLKGEFHFYRAGTENGRVTINAQKITGNNNFINVGRLHGHAIINAREITGDGNFSRAGYVGHAIINAENITGNKNFRETGTYQGYIIINAKNTIGNQNFESVGAQHGQAIINAQNTIGNNNFYEAGRHGGKALIVAKELYGMKNFEGSEGTLILQNPNEKPRIERVTIDKKQKVLELIAQNAPSEEIMACLRGNT